MFAAIASASRRVLISSEFQTETINYMNALGIPDDSSNSIYGITNNQLWLEVDNFITTLKPNSLLTKAFRIFLKLGNTANQQAIDLIDPSRSGTFSGSWVFGANGATGNGANTLFDSGFPLNQMTNGDSGLTATLLSIDEANSGDFARLIGRYTSPGEAALIYAKRPSSRFSFFFNDGLHTNNSAGSKIGVQTVNKINDQVNADFFYSGGLIFSASGDAVGALPSTNGREASDGLSGSYLAGTVGTSVYHEGLTAEQVETLHRAITTFEANINRKTWI